MNQRKPDALDIAVGHRIRIERLARRMSQTELATQIGISFQQLQKYERGLNRVGAGRLSRIAEVLGIPTRTFFEADAPAPTPRRKGGEAGPSLLGLLAEPGAIRALRAFAAMPPRLRPTVLSFLEKLAASRMPPAAKRSPRPV